MRASRYLICFISPLKYLKWRTEPNVGGSALDSTTAPILGVEEELLRGG
jgi:hypothetical protein